MGCGTSKQRRCRHCQAPYSPVSRSYSIHVLHPPQQKDDSYHVVALTSTTLGSLTLDSSISNHKNSNGVIPGKGDDQTDGIITDNEVFDDDEELKNQMFLTGLTEAKSWSNMIQEKIPKIASETEPETINTWELMAGLEDVSPIDFTNHRFRSFSFGVPRDSCPVPHSPKSTTVREEADTKCLEFDPEVISTFRKLLQEPSDIGINPVTKDSCKQGKEKVVLYFTSLRGIRKTYEDCCYVKAILKGLGVRVDERDLSMHSRFKEELRELMGEGFSGGLPRVFIGSKYIGGAEEIKRMHEEGQLEKIVEVCEMVNDSIGGDSGACEACGDIKFVPCETCSGSCKIYYEEEEEEEEEGDDDDDCEFGFQRCQDCNENGLIRCPICCY